MEFRDHDLAPTSARGEPWGEVLIEALLAEQRQRE